MSYADSDAMLAALGSGLLSINAILNRLRPKEEEPPKPTLVQRLVERTRRPGGIKIQKMDNMMFRFANCCQPVPGEKIVGYITRGRGVTVHRADCENVAALLDQPERRLAVEWDVDAEETFLVRLLVGLANRKNLLRDVTQAISEVETNIRSAAVNGDRSAGTGEFVIEVKNLRHLNRVISRIRRVTGVLTVDRSAEGLKGEDVRDEGRT
jgi:GTP pyrophosphokinase